VRERRWDVVDVATQVSLLLGGLVFLVLGIVHAILTIRDVSSPRTFTPPDANLRMAMQASSVAIHPTANLWRAWLGFNLSHAVGVTIFGSALTITAIADVSLFERYLSLQIAAPLIGAVYVVLARLFWYRDPLIGTSLGTVLLAAASLLSQ
jgi:hypothetical protein